MSAAPESSPSRLRFLPQGGSGRSLEDAIRLNSGVTIAAELLRKLGAGEPLDESGAYRPSAEDFYPYVAGALESALRHLLCATLDRLETEVALAEAAARLALAAERRDTSTGCAISVIRARAELAQAAAGVRAALARAGRAA